MHLSAYVCAVVEAMNRSMTKHFWQWAFVYMFELLWKVRINLRLGILKRSFMFMFVLLKRVCKNVKLGILATITCVYICVSIVYLYPNLGILDLAPYVLRIKIP